LFFFFLQKLKHACVTWE